MSKALATKNVAAVLLAVAMVFGFAFSFATPAKADVISDLQAQIQALLAQIQALQGNGGSQQVGGLKCTATFTLNLKQGSTGSEVLALQKFLNSVDGTQLATAGAGSPGNETSYFGAATKAGVIKFQEKFAADVLTPVGLTKGTGNWFASTRAKANALCAGGGTTTPPTPGPVTGTLQVMAGTQPANSLMPESASRVPFTTFTLVNSSTGAVTVNNVTVQKSGLGDKAAFDGVILVDSNGMALGNTKTLNSSNQAVLDAGITLQPGQSVSLTVTGSTDSDNDAYAGQIIGLSVVGINASGTVSGSLPISGAMHTINSTLALGGMSAAVGPLDPDTTSLATAGSGKSIGTTGFIFASVRLTNTGSAEDQWVKSIRWNQSGSASASDLANVVTVVDGTSYPASISADGKYYTAVFPGNGLEIKKGLNKEFSVKADVVGGPARTISFDLYKASDIYVVGNTFAFGITPTQSENGTVGNSTELTAGTPFFSGTVVIVDAGTVSSVSRANEVAAQNVVELSPNQPLGGFAIDMKGEAITVASLTFGFDLSTGESATQLDNITLVDENGVVVAGPVDGTTGSGNDGKVTFTDTVTFPTGRHVYTLKGQLSADFEDGDTIIATTTPNSTYWTSAKGTITGNSITISNSEVTAHTMTVRAGAVVLSIAGTPSAQTIVAGGTSQTVSGINFDATQSGEDVRFNSLKLLYTSSSGDDLNNCNVYDGATRLNSSTQTLATTATNYTFNLDTALVVAKGTVKVVTVKCDVPSSYTNTATFSVGIDISEVSTGTGVTSGQTVTPTSSTGADQGGNTMTASSGGALTVALDSSSPSYAIAAAGTQGVTLGVLRFNGTNEPMTLDRVALQLNTSTASSSPDNLTSVTLWDGATQVGTALFAGTRFATSTLTSTVTIPANGYKTITLKGNLAAIGVGAATTTSGILLEVNYDDSDSTGTRAIAGSGTINRTSSADSAVSGVRVFRVIPTFAKISVPSTTLTNTAMDLYRFSVAAGSQNDVSLYQIVANLSTSTVSTTNGTTTVSDLKVFAYTDSSFATPVAGFTDGQVVATIAGLASSGDMELQLSSILTIPQGTTRYFRVVGTVTGTSGTTSWKGSVTTYIAGDSAYPSLAASLMGNAALIDAASNNDFIWSPNSTSTTPSFANQDWTNGYGVPGLSGAGSDTVTISN